MRLDFNVLWVDDQPGRVESQITAIRRQMSTEGFDFQARLCRTIEEVNAQIADNVFSDEVDLILVDWDLEGGVKGQDAIAEIRSKIQYKDVVFYSAMMDANSLRKLAFDKGLEGIYCASRGDLVQEVIGVFESLVKKVLDLDHTRGIVMGATSDIDYLARDCLNAIHGRLDSAGQQALVADALKRIAKRIQGLQKEAGKLTEASTLAAILGAHAIFTANDGLRMLSRALEREELSECAAYRVFVTAYIEEIIPERNVLGHQVLNPEGKPIAVAGLGGKQISVAQMRQLRCRLLELREEFRGLHRLLTGSF